MVNVSHLHKAASVLCNAVALELCSKSVSRCCFHGRLATSIAAITRHICKAQRLRNTAALPNVRKQSGRMVQSYLQPNDPPTRSDCFQKWRICHALRYLIALFYEALTFHSDIFFTYCRGSENGKHSGNPHKQKTQRCLHGLLWERFAIFCASLWNHTVHS